MQCNTGRGGYLWFVGFGEADSAGHKDTRAADTNGRNGAAHICNSICGGKYVRRGYNVRNFNVDFILIGECGYLGQSVCANDPAATGRSN